MWFHNLHVVSVCNYNSQLLRAPSQTNPLFNQNISSPSLQLQEMSVLLQTSFGDIVIDLYTDRAPNACLNFIKLCKIKHYNNSLVAEVQKNYVAYVKPSEPTTIWNETGHRQPYFKDQIDVQRKINQLGLIATANTGPNLNNSEFFITLTKANITSLSGKHTIFGKVQQGLDVLRKINDTYSDSQNRPQMNIRILHTFVIDDPFEDVQNTKVPSRSPSPIKNSDRLQAIQHLEMLQKCKSEKQIIQATRQQKAKKQAMTLQILGDLPDSNLKPPQNILFICKLNPVTQQKDLQVIFSRFGPVKSVQIVRDWKTGQSLQYGFIQFENSTSCEEAYLKMNNVVIDDRRIQVDFSQSVSKLLHRNKGSGIVISKPKFGDAEEKRRQLLPKSFTGGKDTREKYELITSYQQASNKNAKYKEPQAREYENRERRQKYVQKQERDNKSPEKSKKRKRSRSRSSSERVSKKKERHRSRDRSKQRKQKHKQKKHKRDRSSSRQKRYR